MMACGLAVPGAAGVMDALDFLEKQVQRDRGAITDAVLDPERRVAFTLQQGRVELYFHKQQPSFQ